MELIDFIRILIAVFFVIVMAEFVYLFYQARVSRRPDHSLPPAQHPPGDAFVVFLIPCLNEAGVLRGCIERLLTIPGDNFAVLVIDDHSDDGTAEIAAEYEGELVWLMRRTPPDCQDGKGEALNAALEFARRRVAGRVPEVRLVACVVDADGMLQPYAASLVRPMFSQAHYSGAQLMVRMFNRRESLLARMQDFEFVVTGEVQQQARQRLGCTALGGNAQFTSFAGLERLDGPAWSKCLVEDLELSIRMLLDGQRIAYSSDSYIEQQGLTSWRKLVRQRSRWFQGKLQCWKWGKAIWRSDKLTRAARVDMLHDLYGAMLIMQSSLMAPLFATLMTLWIVLDPSNLVDWLTAWYGLPIVAFYLLAFGATPLLASRYSKIDPEVGFWKALAYAHMYVMYQYHWFPAGWIGGWRQLRGKQGWLKTEHGSRPPAAVERELPGPG